VAAVQLPRGGVDLSDKGTTGLQDLRAHFLTMLGDVCLAAGVAGLEVEMVTVHGGRVRGVPSPHPADTSAESFGDTGYASMLQVDGQQVRLADVRAFVVRSP
jgi:hypothetical protein